MISRQSYRLGIELGIGSYRVSNSIATRLHDPSPSMRRLPISTAILRSVFFAGREAATYYCLWCRTISSAFRQTDGGDDESTGANSRNGVGCIIELSLFLSSSLPSSEKESRPPRYPGGAAASPSSISSRR